MPHLLANASAGGVPTGESSHGPRVSLVLPCRNQAGAIREAIRAADAALAAVAAEHEIIVVDDGSTDGTAEEARGEAAANPRVRVILPRRRGPGVALRTGLQAAALDLIAYAAPGRPCDAGEWRRLLEWTEENDVVSGRRVGGPFALPRRLWSWGCNTLVACLTGARSHDRDRSLTIFRREHLARLEPESRSEFAATEIHARVRFEGLAAAEVALPWGTHPIPAIGSPRGLPGTLAGLLRFWWSRLLFAGRDPAAVGAAGWFWVGLFVLALVAGAMLFTKLSYPLLEPDEGRYAEIVREMAASGDWVIPRLNGVPFYDKPLLFYWLVGGSYRLFGVREVSARLVPALAALLTVLACFVCGRRIAGDRAAFLGALVLALTPGFIQCGRVVILDSLLTLFVSLSFFAAYEAVRGDRLRRAWWFTSAACCALGVMTKGPVALVLLGPPLAAHAWLQGSRARPRWGDWMAYGAVVLTLVAPSYLVLIARDPRFAYHFFIDQHLVRFFLQEYHVEPAWYYVPVLLIGFLPWSFLAVPLVGFLFDRRAEARSTRHPALGFFLLWACWCVLFFSKSSSKLPPYILPAMPAIALLFGCYLDRMLFRPFPASLFRMAQTAMPRLAGVGLAAAWLVVVTGAWKMHLIGLAPAVLHGCLGVAILVALAVWGGRLSARTAWLLCGALAGVVIVGVAHEFVPAWASRRSPLMRYEEIGRMVREDRTPVVCCDGEWGSVPFYLGEIEQVVNCRGLTPEEVVRAMFWQARYLVVVRHKADLDLFRQAAPFMEMKKVLYADEIAVALLEAVPGWAKVLGDPRLPAAWTALPRSGQVAETFPFRFGP